MSNFSIAPDSAAMTSWSKALQGSGNDEGPGIDDVFAPGGKSEPLRVYAPFRFIYDPGLDLFRGNITLDNTGQSPIQGPITLDFRDLPAGVSIANANTTAPDGTPAITLSVARIVRGAPLRIPIFLRDPLRNPLSTAFTAFDIIVTHR
jgi:hypothetical protein